ncbi:hypothetical protein Lalb_Chr02g0140681 [Lupinus albus]|uniref:Uncharacterized protein n=1 Tax=Lupinus albus TaxID=3870 RepID=A0A6A4QTU0_LUPAL|nr:hypothetical protein Lalb_Chr02g0140681 [Lupinus albus]
MADDGMRESSGGVRRGDLLSDLGAREGEFCEGKTEEEEVAAAHTQNIRASIL